MKCNDTGLEIIKVAEGFFSAPYYCPASIISIGFGATRGLDGRPLHMDVGPITQEEGETLLRRDVGVAERAVSRLIRVPLNENEFSALCSFVYNLGSGRLQSSTLRSLLNRNAPRERVAAELPKWRMANGKVLKGLVRRRAVERQLFLTDA